MASFATQNALVALEIAGEAWKQDLVAALPVRWRRQFGAERWRVIESDASTVATKRRETRPIAVSLPSSEILVRRIELPLASRFQLTSLMRFETLRQVPLPLDQVRLDFRIVRRDIAASRMLVELAIIRNDAVAAARSHTLASGIEPEAIFITTEYGPWMARRPFARGWRKAWRDRRYLYRAVRVAIPVFLAVAWVLAARNWASRFEENRDALVVAARDQAADIGPLRQQLTTLNGKLGVLADARGRPSATVVTEEVARLLPDDAWLQEIDIEAQTVRLVGISKHATDLLRIFSASPLFGNVQFGAPLMQASGSDGVQFNLTMTRN